MLHARAACGLVLAARRPGSGSAAAPDAGVHEKLPERDLEDLVRQLDLHFVRLAGLCVGARAGFTVCFRTQS